MRRTFRIPLIERIAWISQFFGRNGIDPLRSFAIGNAQGGEVEVEIWEIKIPFVKRLLFREELTSSGDGPRTGVDRTNSPELA